MRMMHSALSGQARGALTQNAEGGFGNLRIERDSPGLKMLRRVDRVGSEQSMMQMRNDERPREGVTFESRGVNPMSLGRTGRVVTKTEPWLVFEENTRRADEMTPWSRRGVHSFEIEGNINAVNPTLRITDRPVNREVRDTAATSGSVSVGSLVPLPNRTRDNEGLPVSGAVRQTLARMVALAARSATSKHEPAVSRAEAGTTRRKTNASAWSTASGPGARNFAMNHTLGLVRGDGVVKDARSQPASNIQVPIKATAPVGSLQTTVAAFATAARSQGCVATYSMDGLEMTGRRAPRLAVRASAPKTSSLNLPSNLPAPLLAGMRLRTLLAKASLAASRTIQKDASRRQGSEAQSLNVRTRRAFSVFRAPSLLAAMYDGGVVPPTGAPSSVRREAPPTSEPPVRRLHGFPGGNIVTLPSGMIPRTRSAPSLGGRSNAAVEIPRLLRGSLAMYGGGVTVPESAPSAALGAPRLQVQRVSSRNGLGSVVSRSTPRNPMRGGIRACNTAGIVDRTVSKSLSSSMYGHSTQRSVIASSAVSAAGRLLARSVLSQRGLGGGVHLPLVPSEVPSTRARNASGGWRGVAADAMSNRTAAGESFRNAEPTLRRALTVQTSARASAAVPGAGGPNRESRLHAVGSVRNSLARLSAKACKIAVSGLHAREVGQALPSKNLPSRRPSHSITGGKAVSFGKDAEHGSLEGNTSLLREARRHSSVVASTSGLSSEATEATEATGASRNRVLRETMGTPGKFLGTYGDRAVNTTWKITLPTKKSNLPLSDAFR